MLALAKPNIQFPKTKIVVKKKKRTLVVFAFMLLYQTPILAMYSLFQLTWWVMPMFIAGRLLEMEYNEIGVGLIAIEVDQNTFGSW